MGVSPAIASIHFALTVQEKDHHRQVIIELEQIEIDIVQARQPDANEFVSEVLDAFETDNLPVKLPAGNSGIAAQDHHERFAVFLRPGLALLQAENPAVPERLRIQDHMTGVTGLSQRATPTHRHESNEADDSALHEK
jgi:hypothetical protein